MNSVWEITAKHITENANFDWNLTISEIHKKYLQKLQLLKKELQINEDLGIQVLASDFLTANELLSIPIPSKNIEFLPFKGVDKKLSFAMDNQKKIEILYKIILEIREYRNGEKVFREIYKDYTNGFSYPLLDYKVAFTEYFEQCVLDHLELSFERFVKENIDLGSPEEITLKFYNSIINEIGVFIEDIEIEKYCIEKLNELNGGKDIENVIQKLKWKGTPGEFGAIFDKLFDTGFIEVIKNKKNMVRLLHSFFEIKNAKGEIITSDYLYKCFEDKIKSYPNGYLKIPFSDNYHNDK